MTTGILDEDEEAEERFAALPDEEYCPALDPETLTCDLYDARPITCRIFGPAVRSGGDVLGVCELNYHGATDEQIAACQVEVDPAGLEDELVGRRTARTDDGGVRPHPRPMNGMFVAITVRNCTLASNGRFAM